MTQHITNNGIQINGTTGKIQMSTVVAVRDFAVAVRPERDRRGVRLPSVETPPVVTTFSGKRLSKCFCAKKRDVSFSANPLCSSEHFSEGQRVSEGQQPAAHPAYAAHRFAAELPAAAWATFVMSRTDSFGAVSL